MIILAPQVIIQSIPNLSANLPKVAPQKELFLQRHRHFSPFRQRREQAVGLGQIGEAEAIAASISADEWDPRGVSPRAARPATRVGNLAKRRR